MKGILKRVFVLTLSLSFVLVLASDTAYGVRGAKNRVKLKKKTWLSCRDTDGGNTTSQQGTVWAIYRFEGEKRKRVVAKRDRCINSSKLEEWTCSNGVPRKIMHQCDDACSRKVCYPLFRCEETDQEKDFYQPGSVTIKAIYSNGREEIATDQWGINEKVEGDECLDDYTLREYYCSSPNSKSIAHTDKDCRDIHHNLECADRVNLSTDEIGGVCTN